MTGRDPVAHLRTSMVQIQVGDRLLPMKMAMHCKVCSHPARGDVESQLLVSVPYSKIAEWSEFHTTFDIEGVRVEVPRLTAQQLSNHVKRGHIPVDTQVLSELVEQRERELGIDLTEATGMAVDGVVLAKLVLHKTVAGLQNGELRVEVKDGLAATKLLNDLAMTNADDTEASERMGLMQAAMQRMLVIVREGLDEATWNTLTRTMATDETLAQISQQMKPTDDTKELTA